MLISGTFFILLFCVTLINGKDSIFLLEPNCGTLKVNPRDRITNGRVVGIVEHPWMAHISTRKKCTENSARTCYGQCGGTLITNRFVLTAAHCDLFIQRTTVTLGNFDTSRVSAHGIKVGVHQVIIHPFYRGDKNPTNDIALLQLARTVKYSDFIRPVCVTNHRNLLNLNIPMFATGWGITEYGVLSKVLRRTQLWQYDRQYCLFEFGSMSSSQICAGSEMSDTCQGDSGGPITALHFLDGKYRVAQLGIVSYGSSECNGLGVYTNVMEYFDWIASNIFRQTQTTSALTQGPKRPHSRNVRKKVNNRRQNWHNKSRF